PATRTHELTVRRPRAKMRPKNKTASRRPERGSRALASTENHWHRGAGVCDDGMAASVREGRSCGNAILSDGPALVYSRPRHARQLPISSRKVQLDSTADQYMTILANAIERGIANELAK